MGVMDVLVRKHSVIATNLFAFSALTGFLYTMRTGQSVLTDAKAALTGEGKRWSGAPRSMVVLQRARGLAHSQNCAEAGLGGGLPGRSPHPS